MHNQSQIEFVDCCEDIFVAHTTRADDHWPIRTVLRFLCAVCDFIFVYGCVCVCVCSVKASPSLCFLVLHSHNCGKRRGGGENSTEMLCGQAIANRFYRLTRARFAMPLCRPIETQAARHVMSPSRQLDQSSHLNRWSRDIRDLIRGGRGGEGNHSDNKHNAVMIITQRCLDEPSFQQCDFSFIAIRKLTAKYK